MDALSPVGAPSPISFLGASLRTLYTDATYAAPYWLLSVACVCVCLCMCACVCYTARVPPACTHTYTLRARGVGGGEDSCYTYATSSKLLPLLSSPKNSAKIICKPRLSFSLPPRSLIVAPSLSFLLRNDLSSHPILFLFSFSLSFSFSFDLSRHLFSLSFLLSFLSSQKRFFIACSSPSRSLSFCLKNDL